MAIGLHMLRPGWQKRDGQIYDEYLRMTAERDRLIGSHSTLLTGAREERILAGRLPESKRGSDDLSTRLSSNAHSYRVRIDQIEQSLAEYRMRHAHALQREKTRREAEAIRPHREALQPRHRAPWKSLLRRFRR